jgi:hypothetical protein
MGKQLKKVRHFNGKLFIPNYIFLVNVFSSKLFWMLSSYPWRELLLSMLHLGSDKDIADAVFLYVLFKPVLEQKELERWCKELGADVNMLEGV